MDAATTTLRVANTRSVPVTFWLEPYGTTCLMPAGATWTVTASLPKGDHLAVELTEATIVVYAGHHYPPPVTVTQADRVVIDYSQSLPTAGFDPYK